MSTKTNRTTTRTLLVLAMTIVVPHALHAQQARYEQGGEAHVLSELQTMIDRAVMRYAGMRALDARGQVVFFRPGERGDAATVWHDAGKPLHALPGDGYFVAIVPPGTHRYGIGTDAQAIDLEVQPGGSYYIRVGGDDAAPVLSPSSALTFYNYFGNRRDLL